MQPPTRHEFVFLRPDPLRITTILRPDHPTPVRATIPLDLPRNRRMMPIQHSADITRRIPLGNTAGNLLITPLPIARRNPRILAGCRYDCLNPSMDIGNSVRKAINDWEDGEAD